MKGEGEVDGEKKTTTTGAVLKKGPWRAEEDAVLAEYVKRHGEGNWNSVQRRTGLARCGKSCRLRWANHLRPNLKKGHLTPEEEAAILRLHAQMGNKWARMASHLPGRTDNEIKNYWNTRLKRRQRAGLPLYPPTTAPEETIHVPRLQHRRAAAHGRRGTVRRNAAAAAAAPAAMPFFFVASRATAGGMAAPPRRPGTVPAEYGLMPTLPPPTELPSSQFFGETPGGASGLLDMLLQQEELQMLDQSVMVRLGNSDSSTETAHGSSTVAVNAEATDDPMNQATHDEISKLFDMIPAPTMPALPDWYDDNSGKTSNGLGLEMDRSGPVAARVEQEWSIGSFPWNNMPEIC